MMKIVFATKNKGKKREINEIMRPLGLEIKTLDEMDINISIEENGETFEDNALIKAREVAKYTGLNEIVIADDSGLEIDYLNKEPGVHSARFMGEDTSYDLKNQYFVNQLRDAVDEERTARFVCAIGIVFPDGEETVFRATMEGHIAKEPFGENGFGYDPIFYLKEFGKTSAQLSSDEKNQISHRGKALQVAMSKIKEKYAI